MDTCDKADQEEVIKALERWVASRYIIGQLVTNKGKEFMNRRVFAWLKDNDIEDEHPLSNDHRSNGLGERCNQTVLQALRKCSTQRTDVSWRILVKIVEDHVNLSYHCLIGMTPDKAWNLQKMDLWNVLRKQDVVRSEGDAIRYNKNVDYQLKEGDPAWVYQQDKMQLK